MMADAASGIHTAKSVSHAHHINLSIGEVNLVYYGNEFSFHRDIIYYGTLQTINSATLKINRGVLIMIAP
jgi:hypothetical protein